MQEHNTGAMHSCITTGASQGAPIVSLQPPSRDDHLLLAHASQTTNPLPVLSWQN